MDKQTIRDQLESFARQMRLRQWRCAVAESCTGGLLSAAMTDISGSSDWFECGFVTYSNLAKNRMLGVSDATLSRYGAVSAETVLAMVRGVMSSASVQLAAAVSGIAGPSGGSAEKPVGTVWIGIGRLNQDAIAHRFQFDGDREAVRVQSVNKALQLLLSAALAESADTNL